MRAPRGVPGHVFCGYFTTPASRGTLTSGTSCLQVPLGVILCIPPFNYPGESCIVLMCHYMQALVAVLSTVPKPKLPQYTAFTELDKEAPPPMQCSQPGGLQAGAGADGRQRRRAQAAHARRGRRHLDGAGGLQALGWLYLSAMLSVYSDLAGQEHRHAAARLSCALAPASVAPLHSGRCAGHRLAQRTACILAGTQCLRHLRTCAIHCTSPPPSRRRCQRSVLPRQGCRRA